MMAKIVMCMVMFVVVSGQKPKLPRTTEDFIIEKVACSSDHERDSGNIIEQSKCGDPKEVFEYLKKKAAYEQISPSAVWVKRCVGLCEYVNEGTCLPTKTVVRQIPIRIYNAKTNKGACAKYPIVEHVSCGCCSLSPDGLSQECAARRVYNPRKCSCQCPNMQERRNCLKKRNQNMRWNRSKCAYEQRRSLVRALAHKT